MLDALEPRGFAQRTREAYLHRAIEPARFTHTAPDQLDGPDLSRFLLHLPRERHLAPATRNQRLVSLEADRVTFRWRDRAHGHAARMMALPAEGFIHRFLPHVLPRGFQRIRHYGLLANRHKAERLAQARAALRLPTPALLEKETVEAFAPSVLGVDIALCPVCHSGRLVRVLDLPRQRGPPGHA